MTEIYPELALFSQSEIAGRIVEIHAEDARQYELRQELYEVKMREREIAEALGIHKEMPVMPYVPNERDGEFENKQKSEVAKMIGDISVFGASGKISRREERSDDGCGFESNKCFSYEVVDGVLYMSAINHFVRFGWRGETPNISGSSLICAAEGELPLSTDNVGVMSIGHYKKIRWVDAKDEIGELHTALRWRCAIDRLEKIISERGSLVVYEAENPRYNREALRASFENETDEWYVQLGGRFESYNQESDGSKPSIHVAYKNKILNKGFSIEVERDNIRPYISDPFNNTITRHNYLDYVEKVLDLIADSNEKV